MPEINHESWEDAELEYPATWREECMCQARTCKEVGRVHGGVCTEVLGAHGEEARRKAREV